jgi:uncharacterized LabA/DUF88 family protein
MNRVCVFIDGSKFYFSLKRNNCPTRVDYHKLSLALTGPDRQLIRTYYYNASYDPVLFPDQWKTQQPFLESLSKTPYLELKLGKLVPALEGGFKERGSEVLLATDLVYCAFKNICDTVIVLTEEADFSPTFKQVKELGRHVELGTFKDFQSRDLSNSVDLIVRLDEVLEKYGSKIFPQDPEENIGNRLEAPLNGNLKTKVQNKKIS